MRAIVAVTMTMMMLLLLSTATMAKTVVKPTSKECREYIVKPGDYLIKIGQKTKTSWKSIAKTNNLISPYTIYPRQKLIIPDNQWKKVGSNPYTGTWEWAIKQFYLPVKVKEQVRQNIREGKFKWLVNGLRSGQRLAQVTFGQDKIWDNVICSWPKEKAYAGKDYGVDYNGSKYHVVWVIGCSNRTWWVEEKPKEGKREKLTFLDKFDLYVGSGIYESVHYDAGGYYLWAKNRYRPWEFEINDDLTLGLGVFVFGATGNGNDEDYDYHWREFVFGPTAKLAGHHWDADIDLGIGKLYNEGSIDLYKSEQTDDIFLSSIHGNFYSRRDKGKKWLPKTEVNFELRLPYSETHQHSWDNYPQDPNPYDNRVMDLSLQQSIYDFKPADHIRLTPMSNLGFVREYGQRNDFLQFGLGAVLSFHNQDILSLSVFNYKKQLGGDEDQWHWISGYLNLSGIIRAYKTSKIKKSSR